ncbi:MAG TPA: ABC transporter permease [Ramlibacter sp.]|nr:ABC transporter permease [Ramlibacter sp.]
MGGERPGKRTRVVIDRVLQMLPVMLIATLVVFGLLQLVPGDPAMALAGEHATDEKIAQVRQQYGFDKPFLVQYGDWLGNAVRGDLSKSLLSGESVLRLIGQSFPHTLTIVLLAMLLSMAIGVPLGILAATRAGTRTDATVSALSSVGVALPNFWLAMLLVTWFSLQLNWLPATGSRVFADDPAGALRHALLPALALAAAGVAEVVRQLRSSLLEVLSSQYVRTLRAKGLSEAAILWKHGLKNAGVNLLTVVGLLFNRMLGGTVVVEAVFAVPGMGSLIVRAAINKDFPVVQGVVLSMVLVVVLTNFVIDMLYRVLDPRVE